MVLLAGSLWLLLSNATGCTKQTKSLDTETPPAAGEKTVSREAVSSGRSTHAGDAGEVTLRTADWPTVQAELRRPTGRLIVVNVWTTTCLTCVEEFPKFMELSKQFSSRDVSWVTLCCDYDGVPSKPPAYYRPKVLKFLEQHGAVTVNYLLATSLLDFLDAIELSSTPAVLVYNRDGVLLHRFDNNQVSSPGDEFRLSDVKEFLQAHLVQ